MRLRSAWGNAVLLFHVSRRFRGVDVLVVATLVGLLFGLTSLARQWRGEFHPSVVIDLDNGWALVGYTYLSLSRGLIAYVLSLGFSLVYGYWAARDHVAERVLVPLLDVLQSIPVLCFLPGFVLALVAAFPRSNTGLELAAILMIFTGQAWNMTFSFYHSVRSVPRDLQEVADVYGFSAWRRFRTLELPYGMMGLVWNSMMSMAGGWFFLMIVESFRLGDDDFRLPGLGSYMSVAVERGRFDAMLWAILAMALMIVALDQLLWRPIVVWAQKFRMEEGGQIQVEHSWFLDWLRRSRLLAVLRRFLRRWRRSTERTGRPRPVRPSTQRWATWLSWVVLGVLGLAGAWGAWKVVELLWDVSVRQWASLFEAAGWTLGRVLLSTALGTLWAVPAGLAIGLSPRLSRLLQPLVQLLASFPAPMLFPLVVALLSAANVPLGWGSVALMMLGTQWYILFNVVAGAMAVPADLREMAHSYDLSLWRRLWALYLPAVFPYLVTGWVTAAGGAWNASIVSEFVTYRGDVLKARGLGERISAATAAGDFPLLAASTLVMASVVVLFNRVVWQWLYRLAEQRFAVGK
jgi:NitT/TauT family transport system permease protein